MNYKDIKKLVKLLKEEDLSVLSISDKDTHIHIERDRLQANNQGDTPTISTSNEDKSEKSNLVEITASQLGTFYSNKEENSDETFVKVGDEISKGDQIGFIEAMKVFNDVTSDVSGTVEEIVVNNGDTVEYGETLMLISLEEA